MKQGLGENFRICVAKSEVDVFRRHYGIYLIDLGGFS